MILIHSSDHKVPAIQEHMLPLDSLRSGARIPVGEVSAGRTEHFPLGPGGRSLVMPHVWPGLNFTYFQLPAFFRDLDYSMVNQNKRLLLSMM